MKKIGIYIIDALLTSIFVFYMNAFLVDHEVVYSPLKIGYALFFSIFLIVFPLAAGARKSARGNSKIKAQ